MRRNRPLQGFLAGLLVSRLGDQVYGLALPWLVYNLTGSALAMGGIYAAAQAPVLLNPFVGALVDRWDRRRVLLGTALARATLVGCVPALWYLGSLALWQLYLLSFALGLCTLFADLSTFAITPLAVPPAEIPAMNGLLEGLTATAAVTGPALGGLGIALAGAPPALLASSVSFLLTVPPLLAFRPAAPAAAERKPFLRETWTGLAYVLRHPILLPLGLCFLVQNIGSTAAFALLIYFLRHDLSLSPTAAGAILGVAGVAAILGALATPLLQRRLRLSRIILIATLCSGAALLLAAGAHSTAAFVGIALLWGSVLNMISPTTRTLRQRIVPLTLLARVQAGSTLIAWCANPIASLLGGAAAQTWGTRPVFAASGIIVLASTALILLTPLRRA